MVAKRTPNPQEAVRFCPAVPSARGSSSHDVARCPEDDGGCNPSRVGLIPARASTCPRGLTERHSASNRDDGSSILSVGADAFVAQGTSTGVRSQGKLSVEDGRNSGEVKLELGLAVK